MTIVTVAVLQHSTAEIAAFLSEMRTFFVVFSR